MSDEFIALADLLRPAMQALAPEPALPPEPAVRVETVAEDAVHLLASDIRRFRARLEQAFESHFDALLRDLACDVLARELTLAPVEIAAVGARALERALGEAPLGLRANEADSARLEGLGLPVTIDPALRAGDLVLELRDGTLDASLGIRLETILRDRRTR